jgi:phospholipase/carboxylesterase
MQPTLHYIEVAPATSHQATIIWLHGLGADCKNFLGLADNLRASGCHNVKFVFPDAPVRPITLNHGLEMRGWYDLYNLEMTQQEDAAGLSASQKLIDALIEHEHKQGIPYSKIILGGFSQGGVMTLYTGLRFPYQLGGLVCFSGYCAMADTLSRELHAANQDTPILLAHGLFDPPVTLKLGDAAYNALTALELNVNFKKYPIEHNVSVEEMRDLAAYVKQIAG